MNTQKRKIPQEMLPRGIAGRIAALIMVRGHKSIYENVSNVLDLRSDDDLVEIACGSGHFIKKYASHVRNVTSLDLSDLMIKLAAKNNKDRVAAGTGEFVLGDASKLPWEDNKFSVAATMGSFTVPTESLKEMYRVLRPGGRAVVSIEWNAEDGLDHTKHIKKYGIKMYTEDEIRTMMKEVGFSEVSITYAKGLMMPRMLIASAVK